MVICARLWGSPTAEPGLGALSLGAVLAAEAALGALSGLPFTWENRVPRRPEGEAGGCVGEQGLPSLSGRVTLTHPTQGHRGGGAGEGPAPEVYGLEHGTFQVREPRDRLLVIY